MSAPTQGAAVTTLSWWNVPWVCGKVAGVRLVRAPDARSAEHDLERNPSDYGIAHERVIVGRAWLILEGRRENGRAA